MATFLPTLEQEEEQGGEVIDELKKTGKNIQSAINNVLAGKKPQQPRSV